jgi:hypothetical protein
VGNGTLRGGGSAGGGGQVNRQFAVVQLQEDVASLGGGRSVEGGVAEAKDAAISAEEPISTSVG